MASISKFYFHTATTTDTGTLPGAGTTLASIANAVTGPTGWDTNRSMDDVIGTSQTSMVFTNPADLLDHTTTFLRFCSAPIATQTITFAQSTTVSLARAESSLISDFFWITRVVAVWRPAGGTLVGRVISAGGNSVENTVAATEQTYSVTQNTETGVNALNGDILVIELGRTSNVQTMATAYTNTIYYDGTTEASATSCASFLQFANAVTMSGGALPTQPRSVLQAVKRSTL